MTAIALEGTRLNADAPIPFERLVRTELRKVIDTRASRWLLAAIIACTPIVVVVMLFVAKPHDLNYAKFVDFTQSPQKYLLPVLGLLTVTSEWSQRTGIVTFTLVPDRRRVLLAKFTATLALGLLVIALVYPAAAIGNVLGAAFRGGSGSWASGAVVSGEVGLVVMLGLVMGMAFGMAIMLTAAAVVAYYLVPNLTSVAFGASAGVKHAAPWFDLNQATSPLYSHDMTGTGWVQLVSAVAIWIGVPLAIGVLRVSRTEVKSS
ncbi:MAG TPA: hypothetical protein VFL65_08995 [Jatrophihabitans sp.]|nr:hypothetical protein [Jatrophihabitans sp.]